MSRLLQNTCLITPNHDLSCERSTVILCRITSNIKVQTSTLSSSAEVQAFESACCHVETPQNGRWDVGRKKDNTKKPFSKQGLSLLLTLISVNYTNGLSRTPPLLIVRPLPSLKLTRIQIYGSTVPSAWHRQLLPYIRLPPDVFYIWEQGLRTCHKYNRT